MQTSQVELLHEVVSRGVSDHNAIIDPSNGLSLTYGALERDLASVRKTLQDWGFGRGDVLALALPNGIEFVSLFLSSTATAATAAPLNPAYTADEFGHYLTDMRAKAVILPRGSSEQIRSAALSGMLQIEVSYSPDSGTTLDLVRGEPGEPANASPGTGDTALFLHTSGTTSRPKGVPLTHRNLLTSTQNIIKTYTLTSADRALCVMPLFHIHGLVASTLSTFASGGTVILPPKFSASSFWPTVSQHGPTWYSAVPTIHQVLLSRADSDKAPRKSSLRFARSSSAPLAPTTMLNIEQRFGCPVVEAYGMTEAAHQMASNPLPPGERKPGTVGKATGLAIGIMDQEDNLLGAQQVGEVVIQGDNVMEGYHQNPEANAAAFSGVWFRTGDQGFLDEQGYLTLVGRLKELINRGGEKISPREIDEALLSHEAVTEAIAFGIPDEKYGEEVAVAVVRKSSVTENELADHCRRYLAAFKVPKTFYFTENIPRTATGKVQRRIVAETFAKL